MDRAPDFGSVGCGFDSCLGRQRSISYRAVAHVETVYAFEYKLEKRYAPCSVWQPSWATSESQRAQSKGLGCKNGEIASSEIIK